MNRILNQNINRYHINFLEPPQVESLKREARNAVFKEMIEMIREKTLIDELPLEEANIIQFKVQFIHLDQDTIQQKLVPFMQSLRDFDCHLYQELDKILRS